MNDLKLSWDILIYKEDYFDQFKDDRVKLIIIVVHLICVKGNRDLRKCGLLSV